MMKIPAYIFLPVSFLLAHSLSRRTDSLSPLGITISFSNLIIRKDVLTPLANLQNLNPTRVKIIDSIVYLKGPVCIVSNAKAALILNLALSTLLGLSVKKGVDRFMKSSLQKEQQEKSLRANLVGTLAGIAFGFIAWKMFSRMIPTTTGIFFYNFPPKLLS